MKVGGKEGGSKDNIVLMKSSIFLTQPLLCTMIHAFKTILITY